MKKINLLTSLLLFFSLLVSAQQVPNSGFDTFEADALNGTGVRPTGWNSSNIKRTVMGITATGDLVYEEAAGRNGKCVRLESVNVGVAGITEPAPAWTTLGKPWNYLSGIDVSSATAGTDGGIQFKYRPDTIAVWIKRTYSTKENAHIVFYSWKGTSKGSGYMTKKGPGNCGGGDHFDEESDIRRNSDGNSCGTVTYATQVAEACWRSSDQYPNWTEVKIPIQYLTDDVPEKMNIIFSANNYPNFRSPNVNASAKLYVDDLRLIYSSSVHEVLLNNRAMPGFTPNQTYYTYALGATATSVPSITLKRSGRQLAPSEYTITYGALGEDTQIEVRAEDGSSTTTYTIKFVGTLSNNPRPAAISFGGVNVPNFNPYVYNYSMELPYGTTECPDVEVTNAENGQTFSVVKPATLPGAAVVTVTAADGITTQNYTINLSVAPLSDNTLTDIKVNGHTITGFNPTTNNYVVELPMGTTADPVIEYTSAYPAEHDVVIVNNGISGGATVSVTVRGTTNTRVYRLRFVVTASTYSFLQSIAVGGEPLAGFDPATLSYNVNLPLGTTSMPAITWVQGDEYQTVSIVDGGLNGVTKITVTSQSGAVSIYRLTFATAQSSVSTLNAIMIDGEALVEFSPTTLSYTVPLAVGVTTLPAVTWTKGDEYQTVTYTAGAVNATSRIVVKAQDGSVTTYSITFTATQATNSTLLDIKVGGVSIEGFLPENTTYSIVLPQGTTTLPEITYTQADEFQDVRVVKGGINGDTRIMVKAQSGASTTYVLSFSVETNNNVNLLDIRVGGVSLADFAATTTEYTYLLPSGTTTLPEITYTQADAAQRVVVTRGGVNGTTTILVIAEDNTQRTYSITFSVEKSENALLEMIYLDGTPLAAFDPATLAYKYEISRTAESCPVVTVDKAAGQSVSIIAPRLTGTIRIAVTPETGSGNVYTVDVHYPMSSDAQLSAITLGGNTIENFQASVFDYNISLPIGTTLLPEIGYTTVSADQQVYVVSGGVNGTTTIYVRAEDGTVVTYSLHFSVVRSSASALKSITIGGELLAGFDPETTHYIYMLSSGVAKLPAVTATPVSDRAKVAMVAPENEGVATITVVSEDVADTTIYIIDFRTEASSDVSLSEITLNGEPLDFDAFVNGIAEVDLAADDELPVVACRATSPEQKIAIADAGINGCEILVVAEDGTEARYVIHYNVAASKNSVLAGIQLFIDNRWQTIEEFAADNTSYSRKLAWRTRTAPMVNPLLGQSGQSVKIEYGAVGEPTIITVTAEDGKSTSVYTINYTFEQSSVTTLDAIYYDGKMLSGFNPDERDYTITLAAGVATAPQITWDNATANDGSPITEQRVVYHSRPVTEVSTIEVIAEDGTLARYNISYKSLYPTNRLLTMSVGNSVISGFDKDVFEYSVALPYGATTVPEVKYLKAYPEQQVIVTSVGGVNGKIEVMVMAADDEHTTDIYTIDLSVSDVPNTALAAVSVDGVALADFAPAQTTYVVITDSETTPVITVQPLDGCQYEVKINNAFMCQLEAYNLDNPDETLLYTFYFHYNTDVIPNANFDNWTTARYNNAAKPLGWTVPADCAEKYKYWLGDTYTTGGEVHNLSGVAKLNTCFGRFSIAGSIPGMMTLGDMSINLTSSNKSTSSVSGGIPFRNSPDRFVMDYKPVANSNFNNWHTLITLSDGENVVNTSYDGSYDAKGTWAVLDMPLNYEGLTNVSSLNVTVNAAWTESAYELSGNGWGGATERTSELHVDNLRFVYSSALTDIQVDGVSLPNFNKTVYSYDVTLNPDYVGLPVITCVGEVADQEHRIAYSVDEANDNNVVVTITSKAEDGTATTYTINCTRPDNTVVSLADIVVGDQSLVGFNPEQTDVVIAVDDLQQLPDLRFVPVSGRQTVSVAVVGKGLEVKVLAENGDDRIYNISYTKALDHNVSLAAVEIKGYEDFAFAADNYNYTLPIAADASLPNITFDCGNKMQQVILSHDEVSTIKVVSEATTDTAVYTISFVREQLPTTSTLTTIAVNDMSLDEFAADVYLYKYINLTNEPLVWTFARGAVADRVSQSITANEVSFTVVGSDTTRYDVTIENREEISTALTTLQVDGMQLLDFTPSNFEYFVSSERGDNPQLYARVSTGAQLSVNYVTEEDGYMLNFAASTPLSNELANTIVHLSSTPNNDALLGAILLNGEPLALATDKYTSSAAFDPELTEYSVTVLADSPKMCQPLLPSLSVQAGAYGQQISIATVEYDIPVAIDVEAQTGATNTYYITFTAQKSAENRLEDIAVNYSSIAAFAPDTYSYQVEVASLVSQPVVAYRTIDAYEKVDVVTADDRTTLTVRAENGTTVQYVIDYIYSRSSVTTLDGITLDGETLGGFSSDVHDYNITLPVGTSTLPMIAVVAGDDGQQITITEGGVNGTTTIRVVAEDGNGESEYRLVFTRTKSTNVLLEMIYVDGEPLVLSTDKYTSTAAFDASEHNYTITLPIGVKTAPQITWDGGDQWQTIEKQVDEDGTITIHVVAEDDALSADYRVSFAYTLSANAQLSMIIVDGHVLAEFAPETLVYNVTLPVGTTTAPEVMWVKGDQWQSVTATQAADVNGTAVIEVVAEDGETKNIYSVAFERVKSDVVSLQSIELAGNIVEGFAADVTSYDIVLPVGTTELPVITWIRGDEYQIIDAVDGGVNGEYVITVTAENGDKREYILHFSVEKSHNALLAEITYQGVMLNGFDAEIFDYTITLPYGTTAVPEIGYVMDEPEHQLVEYTPATLLTEVATIRVTAEDGTTTNTYSIAFVVERSGNAQLASITIGGELIAVDADGFTADKDFVSDEYDYNILLPYGTTTLPVIEWVGEVADYTSITMVGDTAVNTKVVITVVSDNEKVINEYSLTFTVRKSDNAYLADLQVGNGLLHDFDYRNLDYTILFPIGTDTASLPTAANVVYRKQLESQTVTVDQTIPTEIVVTVLAEDGVTINVYVVHFEIELSSNSLLADILVDGISIRDFAPDVFEYTYLLMPGAQVPNLEGVKSEESQVVDVTMSQVGEPSHIYVDAEDGTTSEYKVTFTYTDVNPGEQPSKDDVVWTPLGDGNFQASSLRDNVYVMVYLPSGVKVCYDKVGLVDPNDDISKVHSGGTVFHFERKGQTYIYTFIYDGKVVKSGKFAY